MWFSRLRRAVRDPGTVDRAEDDGGANPTPLPIRDDRASAQAIGRLLGGPKKATEWRGD